MLIIYEKDPDYFDCNCWVGCVQREHIHEQLANSLRSYAFSQIHTLSLPIPQAL